MRSIGPKISDRHYEMLADLTRFFEGQRPAIERAIEETHTKYIKENRMNSRIWDWAQHQAEEIAQAHGSDANCTVSEVRADGSIVFDLEDGADSWVGTLHDGESIRDIDWLTS